MSTELRIEQIPPALAHAIVEAQKAADSLERDGKGDKGSYTTADAIAREAARVLNLHGAAWMRVRSDLAGPALSQADIGKQHYVGDVIEEWMIMHESGAALCGGSRMPVIVSAGRPHDKAASASWTYDAGVALRGALCLEREGKDAIDQRRDGRGQQRERLDDEGDEQPRARPQPPPRKPADEPKCTGHGQPIADANRRLVNQLAEITGDKPGKLWREWCRAAKVPPSTDGHPPTAEQLTVSQGLALKGLLESAIDHRLAELGRHAPTERQPGDDPDEPEGLDDDAAAVAKEAVGRVQQAFGGAVEAEPVRGRTSRRSRAGGEAPA